MAVARVPMARVVTHERKRVAPGLLFRLFAPALLSAAVLVGFSTCPALAYSPLGAPAGVPLPQPLTSVGAIRALSSALAAQSLPVRLDAVVTYYQPGENMLFVQDATGAVYVHTSHAFDGRQGSRVIVTGVTAESYRNTIEASDVQSIGDAPLPTPRRASFEDLINGVIDCDFVQVRGKVRSSTIQMQNGIPFLLLEISVGGGPVKVHVRKFEGVDFNAFLDTQIEFAAASGKAFDGKLEPVGVLLYVEKLSSIHVISRSRIQPQALPHSFFESVSETYGANDHGKRVRVRGTVTLYDPGEMLVLDQRGKSLLVHTHQGDPLSLGQVVDAIGFSDYQDYAPSLDYGQFIPTSTMSEVTPRPISYDEAMTGKHSFNLVSLTGVLVAQVHGTVQDALMLKTGEHVYSAVYRSTQNLAPLQLGSQLRVTGICLIDAYGPYNLPVDFELRLRSPADIAVLTLPSWITVDRLARMVGMLSAVMLASLLWAGMLRRRVAAQTEEIQRVAEEDAAAERRTVYLEKQRSRVLEAINSSEPLNVVLSLIAAFLCEQIPRSGCVFHLSSNDAENPGSTVAPGSPVPVGASAEASPACSASRRTIYSSDGIEVAEMVLTRQGNWQSSVQVEEVLHIGGGLAALAIENRTLHEKLVHRSEYDQLTDVPNRFLIEGRLERALAEARQSGGRMAVIYIDLDQFKQVNDEYGHRVGDMYLQQAAHRMSAQLRDRDLIARIGGDEFLAVVHDISGREEAESVARRLTSCFLHPFSIGEFHISGSASIGIGVFPEDGQDGDELKRVADSAMYELKRSRKLASMSLSS